MLRPQAKQLDRPGNPASRWVSKSPSIYLEYKLLSTEDLAIGELNRMLADLATQGWEVDRLLGAGDAPDSADIGDLDDLGVLLRRERRM
ncbi:hypothetical protein JW859_11110 [bacterium]|nr:hypothetical protein [bacterium]